MSKSTMTDYAITIYNYETSKKCNEFNFSGDYIKAVEIQQNKLGNTFAVVYNDDNSKFRMIVFDKNE